MKLLEAIQGLGWPSTLLFGIVILLLLFAALKIDAAIKREQARKRKLERERRKAAESTRKPPPPLIGTPEIPFQEIEIEAFEEKREEKKRALRVAVSEPTTLLPSREEIMAELDKERTIEERPVWEKKDDPTTVELNRPASPGRYSVGFAVHIGTRKYQQDALFVSDTEELAPNGMLLGVLCDGMGGMANGEKASLLAVETMRRDFYALAADADVPAFLDAEAHRIDMAINDTLSENRDGGTGTTIVAVALRDNMLYWLSAGDSRIYILRGTEIVQVTRDHNFSMVLAQRVKRGEITEDAMENHSDKNALISYLGMGGLEIVDCTRSALPLEPGDIILLCSDGLTGALSAAQIQSFIRDAGGNMLICARTLTHKALEHRKTAGQDNTSVILIRYNG